MTAVIDAALEPLVETSRQQRSRLVLAAVMLLAGALHFVIPDTYARLVPHALGDPRTIVHVIGIAEAACGVLLANRTTRRIGGWCTAGVLLAVFPANVHMALDGGLAAGSALAVSPMVAWLRLPLQLPLIAWALSHARRR